MKMHSDRQKPAKLTFQISLRIVSGGGLCASIYGYISNLFRNDTITIGSLTVSNHLLEVSYVFLFCLCAFLLISLSLKWLSEQRKLVQTISFDAQLFGALHSDICELRDELASILNKHRGQGSGDKLIPLSYVSKLWELVALLDELNIPHPMNVPHSLKTAEETKIVTEWSIFLMRIAACSRVHNVKRARATLSYMRKEKQEV